MHDINKESCVLRRTTMKKMVILLGLAMFMATSASAVIDPDPNMMGLYWDTNADMPCTPAVGYPVNMYIILTNPTGDSLGGFECAYTIEGAAQPYILSALFTNPDALDVAAGFQNFIVGFGSPQPTTEATILATISVLNAASMDLGFYLHQSSPASVDGVLPVILSDGELMTVGTSTGAGELTAVMGADCVVATEEASWDSVKSLYR